MHNSREVCTDAIDRMPFNEGKIEGSVHMIQMDESTVGHRKNNRGRPIEGKN
jgi:hypothetical protein